MKSSYVFTVLITLFFLTLYQNTAFAVEVTPSVSPTVMVENKEVQYELPYPGMLPDNRLYFFKVFRDSLQSFFISDPVKKAEFNLLQADKFINIGFYLSNQKSPNEKLISSAIVKAITHFEQAQKNVDEARKQGIAIAGIVNKMDIASQKYQQVLLHLQKKSSDSLKKDLITEQKRLLVLQSRVLKVKK